MSALTVVFMGVCGSGKSSVAERYAQRTGSVVVEADAFHSPANVAKMQSGQPLNDADRAGWLQALAQRIAEGKRRGEAMAVTCSALKKSYRDVLRQGDPALVLVHLTGTPALLAQRMQGRQGHFMPSTLLASQLQTLEAPSPQVERCLQVDITPSLDEITQQVITALKSFA